MPPFANYTRLLRIGLMAIALSACDGETVVRDDAGPPPDARRLSDGQLGVDCEGAQCAAGAEVCCNQVVLPPNGRASFCVEADAAPCDDLVLRCDGPEDCDGGICCSTLDGVSCVQKAEDCQGSRVCQTSTDCTGLPCCASPLGLFRTCRSPCG